MALSYTQGQYTDLQAISKSAIVLSDLSNA